jgi:hypothetical protein
MSEFQLNEGQGFIYIGEYFHKSEHWTVGIDYKNKAFL